MGSLNSRLNLTLRSFITFCKNVNFLVSINSLCWRVLSKIALFSQNLQLTISEAATSLQMLCEIATAYESCQQIRKGVQEWHNQALDSETRFKTAMFPAASAPASWWHSKSFWKFNPNHCKEQLLQLVYRTNENHRKKLQIILDSTLNQVIMFYTASISICNSL